MKKICWEYKLVSLTEAESVGDLAALNFFGAEGWELVAMRKALYGYRAYFKRERAPERKGPDTP